MEHQQEADQSENEGLVDDENGGKAARLIRVG